MFKKFKTIKYLRRLSKKEVSETFLASLRSDLSAYMKTSPAPNRISIPLLTRLQFFNMRYATISLVVIAAIISGGGITLASFDSLPGDKLYPVKAFSEDMKSLMAFTPEAKQKLEENLASRRIAEVEILMAKPEVSQAKINTALSRLDKHMNDAVKTVEAEKNKGNDVNEMAKSLSKKFDAQQDVLEEIFRTRNLEMKEKSENIKESLKEAQKIGNATTTKKLSKELDKIDIFRNKIKTFRDVTDKKISDNKQLIEKELEINEAANKAIADAKNAKDAFADEALKHGWIISGEDLDFYDDFLNKAENALAEERFIQARQFAKQAEEFLKKLGREKEKDDDDNDEKRTERRIDRDEQIDRTEREDKKRIDD